MGKIRTYEWIGNGKSRVTEVKYLKPGTYSEILKINGVKGEVSYDFATINVLDPARPEQDPITINANYYPSLNVKPRQLLAFKVRTFGTTEGEEAWDFGDGGKATTRSDGNVKQLAKDGYAETTHAFDKPGDYIVRITRGAATTHLWVPVRQQ
jgi:hypothetical protein